MQGERFGRPSLALLPDNRSSPVVSAMEITPEGGSVKAEDSKTRGALLAVLLDG